MKITTRTWRVDSGGGGLRKGGGWREVEEGGGVEGGLRRVRAPPLSKGGMRTGEMRSYGTEASVQWAWYIIDTEP